MKLVQNCAEITAGDAGQFVRFGGRGIMDGLKCPQCKADCYRIVEVTPNEIVLRQYRKRFTRKLPAFNFGQQAEVYTATEYAAMPAFA